MLSSDRRWFLGAVAALAGCGFQPVHRAGGPGARLRGKVTFAEARTPTDFAFRERLRRSFNDAGEAAAWRLGYDIQISERGAAIAQDLDITRFNLIGTSRFVLTPLASDVDGHEGIVTATSSFDAVAEAFATRAARKAARHRLAEELAERTSNRLISVMTR